jgi:hypothetical protein
MPEWSTIMLIESIKTILAVACVIGLYLIGGYIDA